MMNITNKTLESPISGFIAEAVMQSIEAKIMAQYRPRLWLKYVDGTFVIINHNDLEHFHKISNSMNASIKFSGEEEQNNQLPFLVQRHRDGKINTSVYRKSSNSDIVLHYSSTVFDVYSLPPKTRWRE